VRPRLGSKKSFYFSTSPELCKAKCVSLWLRQVLTKNEASTTNSDNNGPRPYPLNSRLVG